MTSEAPPVVAPRRQGWYPDPRGGPGERWYDGEGWTGRVRRPDLRWRPAGGIAAVLASVLVLASAVCACLAYLFSERREVVAATRGVDTRAFDANERAITIAGFAGLGLAVAVVVLWLVWFAIAYQNARTLRDVRLPRSALWTWLVPLANLVLPKLMVDDLWVAGDEDRDTEDGLVRRSSLLVDAWWATLAGSAGVLIWGDSRTRTLAQDRAGQLDALGAGAGVLRFGFALASLSALLAALVVLRATFRLHRRRARAERA